MMNSHDIIYIRQMINTRELEQEISNQINFDSPTKYDMDFYKRKVGRLQNDCNSLQEDLNKARIRLRRAEDFELKYELVLKQNTHLQNEVDKKDKQLNQKRSQLENLKLQASEKNNKGEDDTKQKMELQREIQKWKEKAEEAEEKRISFMLENREKADLNQKREVEGLKKQFAEKEEGYQFQIRQLKKTVSEKQNIEAVIASRVEKVRLEKDQEIRRLQQFIEKQRVASEEAYREKSEQLDKLRDKFQKIFNFELENLKKSMDDQDELFNLELNGFREMMGLKNDQISKLLERIRKENSQHQHERQEFLDEIAILKEKVYVTERENELELNNIKERITKLHANDLQSMEERYNSTVQAIKTERKEFQRQLKEKDRIVEAQERQYERLKHEMHDRLKERDQRIEHLQERIKQTSEMNESQMKNLHQSFHQIESQKQLMASEYQTNVGFLNQQLSKLTVKNETLNATIKSLHEDAFKSKKEFSDMILDIENRWKKERAEVDQERLKDKETIEKLQDQNREIERVFKVKEKQLERAREKEQRQKNKLHFMIEEMERDTERLNNYIKQLDDNLKRELKKNQMANLDTGGIRRELNAELERQKSQLEAIKRMEVDQIRSKMEVELTKLMNQNQKLQTNLQQKSLALDNMSEQFKKLEHLNKIMDRINKDKLVQYEKKMATLNSEINLTQTLYNQFLETKARQPRNQ